MSLYYASKYVRRPGDRPRRAESIGFSSLTTALAVVREMTEVARPGEVWVVTAKVDGAHVPAVVGQGSGAAVLIAAGVYDIERAGVLEPLTAA